MCLHIAKNVLYLIETQFLGCIVTFEFDPIDKKPEKAEGGFSASTNATTAAICARRCYQDGCTGASYEPTTGACLLTYGDYDSCTNKDTSSIFKGTDTIWIRCARCREIFNSIQNILYALIPNPFQIVCIQHRRYSISTP